MSTPDRKLVLVDLENLAGCAPCHASPEIYRAALESLLEAGGIAEDDHVVIGVNPGLAFVAHSLRPTARLVTRSGPDGAELCLIDELWSPAFIVTRYAEVIIASGDNRFADSIVALNEAGLNTTVASLPGQLSARVRLAAHRVVWLSGPNLESMAA